MRGGEDWGEGYCEGGEIGLGGGGGQLGIDSLNFLLRSILGGQRSHLVNWSGVMGREG